MKLWHDLRAVVGPLFAAQRIQLSLGALLAMATVLMGMGLLGLSGWFITATALTGAAAASLNVFLPSAGIRLLALGRTGSRYAERLVTHDATFGALAALREHVFRGWAAPGGARQLLARPSRLLFRLTADIDALETIYLRLLVPAVAATGAALLAGVVLGFMSVAVGVVLAIWSVATGCAVTFAVASRAQRPAVARAQAMEALRSRTIDLLAGQTELVMAGRLDAQRDLLAAADRHLAHADLALNLIDTRAAAAQGLIGTLTLVGVLIAVGMLVDDQLIGAPAAALALLVALTATEPFAALRRGALDAARARLALRRLAPRLAAAAPEAPAVALDEAQAVRLQAVTTAHVGCDADSLRDVSLTIDVGERVALIGPSGAGKSTLLALVAGELSARCGTAVARPHGLLMQRIELFRDSLRDNLRLADPGASDERLWDVLGAAGLRSMVQSLDDGLDTMLGEGGLGLSAGQARRLALARLLLRDVPLWLFDEPTEAIDAPTAHDVLERLRREPAGRSLVIATHLRREAELADRIICLRAGRIEADLRRGTPAFDAALNQLRAD